MSESAVLSLFLHDPRILVVDDEHELAEITASILRGSGADVRIATDGTHALAAIAQYQPDVIISDICMPMMRGDQLLAELRKTGFMKPVIMVTGHGEMNDAIEALRHDAFDFLNKPFTRQALLGAVQKALRFECQRLLVEAELKEAYRLIYEKAEPQGGESWEKIVKERARALVREARGKRPR